MEEKYYIYSLDTKEIKEYSDLETFLDENIVNEDYLEELYNEYFEYVNLPIIGNIGTGTLLRRLGRLWEGLDDEIEFLLEEIEYTLNNVEDVSYFENYYISKNLEFLKKEIDS